MKPKQGSRRARDLENRETRWLRYRSGLVALLDRVRTMVDGAPEELAFRRESVRGLLMAAHYIVDINTPFPLEEDVELVRRTIHELRKALGPLGLGVDYWDKIEEWCKRDLRERGASGSLLTDL